MKNKFARNADRRFCARIGAGLHALLKRAAELQGRTIEQAEVIRLSMADQQCFADALRSPPKPQPALRRTMARRDKLLCTNEE